MAGVQEGGFYLWQELSWHVGTGDSGVQERLALFQWVLGIFQIQNHVTKTLLHGQTGSLPALPQLLEAWEGKTNSHSKD